MLGELVEDVGRIYAYVWNQYYSNKKAPLWGLILGTGGDLLFRAVSSQVPSALKGLTSVFEMGTGDPLRLCHRKVLHLDILNSQWSFGAHCKQCFHTPLLIGVTARCFPHCGRSPDPRTNQLRESIASHTWT